MSKKALIILGIILILIIIPVGGFLSDWFRNGGTNSLYQHDKDIIRMKHLIKIGNYLEEYKAIKGHYPLVKVGDETPNYVYIASEEQKGYINSKPPYKHTETDVSILKRELEQVLKKKVDLPIDPQRVPMNKPNFYIYMTQGEIYNLAIHLHNEFNFTQKVADFYNKLEVSNYPNPEVPIWDFKELLQNEDFIKASSEKLYR